jgi:phosphatidylinositol kinase/protein kinase (PI-3  family)
LIETIPNCISIHSLKKDAYAKKLNRENRPYTLKDYYIGKFGSGEKFEKAQENFMKSFVGYSLTTFILAIKDRHNGNILIDNEGHIIHIDFGFMLSNSPGGSIGFEMAPFKFSLEYLDLMGGIHGPLYSKLRQLFVKGFLALRKHSEKIILLVEMMQASKQKISNSRFTITLF